MRRRIEDLSLMLLLGATLAIIGHAQVSRPSNAATQAPGTSQRTRLILKDGSYQIVLRYEVSGKIVRYYSAERDATEEIPADLVDWEATHKWERQHAVAEASDAAQAPAPTIDPELLREEADRAEWRPEVAPDLHLPELDSVLALDNFRGTPELVPLVQSDGELNRVTGHNVLKLAINPRSASHQIEQLKGEAAAVQLHVDRPAIYLRLGDDSGVLRGGTPLVVDTHGAGSDRRTDSSGGSPDSGYVLVRADIRTDARVIASFNIAVLGGPAKTQQNVIETVSELLPGGHWMKLTPKHPLDVGEYVLMEIVADNEINLGVWDFGVHPMAPENGDVFKPQAKKPLTLQRREPQ